MLWSCIAQQLANQSLYLCAMLNQVMDSTCAINHFRHSMDAVHSIPTGPSPIIRCQLWNSCRISKCTATPQQHNSHYRDPPQPCRLYYSCSTPHTYRKAVQSLLFMLLLVTAAPQAAVAQPSFFNINADQTSTPPSTRFNAIGSNIVNVTDSAAAVRIARIGGKMEICISHWTPMVLCNESSTDQKSFSGYQVSS